MNYLKQLLGMLSIILLIAACKKDTVEHLPKEKEFATLSGIRWSKPKPSSSKSNHQKILLEVQKNKQIEQIESGTFYTTHGTLRGIRFNTLDGNEVTLERSRVPGSCNYNCVTDVGRYIKNEQLSMGMTKSDMIKLGEKDKWPSYIMNKIESDYLLN